MKQAQRLAIDHWDYISSLLKTYKISGSELNKIKFHYISAFIHGYKHGQEDMFNNLFTPGKTERI